MKKNSKHFFLISFLPALAYWYLEENYSLEVALTGGILLSVIEMLLEKIFTKHIHTLSKFNFALILGLGSLSLLASEGIWFKLQPFFTGVVMGGYLLFRNLRGKSLITEMVNAIQDKQLPPGIMEYMERNMAIFLIGYGLFMAYVALKLSTDQWLFYKTIGFYLISFIFMLIQMIFVRKKMRKV